MQETFTKTKKPKRVLIFSIAYFPRFVGGAEIAVREITDRILSEDVLFDMVTVRDRMSPVERIGNINVYRVGSTFLPLWTVKILFPLLASVKALRLHREHKYDIAWSIMAAYAGFATLFFKLLQPRVRFLLTLQEGDPIPEIKRKVWFVWPFFKMIFRKSDSITAISTCLAKWAKDMGTKSPVEVVANGVSVKNFQFLDSTGSPPRGTRGAIFNFQKIFNEQCLNFEDARKKIRQKLGLSVTDVLLVTTSRLVRKNGVGDIIRALNFLPEKVKLLVIGSGRLEPSLRLQVVGYRLQDRVKFLGFVPHEKLPPYLWASDIFVRPSLSEGMGNSFIEAMAAGLPVIGTPVGGIPDFLIAPLPHSEEERHLFSNSHELENRRGEIVTGLFCEVGNPKSIAEKVKLLLSNDELRHRIVESAAKLVAESYDWKLIAKKMSSLLVSLP